MIFMLAGDGVRLTKLTYQHEFTQTYRMVKDTQGLSVAWISVAAESEQVVALGINDNNELQVGLYTIVSAAVGTLELQLERLPAARPLSKPHPHPRRHPLAAAQPPTRAHTRSLPQAPRTPSTASSSYRNSTAFIWHSSGVRCPPRRPPALKTSRPSQP
jgi:hypothetical protein